MKKWHQTVLTLSANLKYWESLISEYNKIETPQGRAEMLQDFKRVLKKGKVTSQSVSAALYLLAIRPHVPNELLFVLIDLYKEQTGQTFVIENTEKGRRAKLLSNPHGNIT
jgi:hypothetical protein